MTQDPDPDGVENAMSQTVRTTGMVAGYVAQNAAMAVEQRALQDAQDAAERTREARNRWDAQRRAALAQLAPNRSEAWRAAAQLPDLVEAWRTARGWAGADPHAGVAEDQIARTVRDRYGIDLRAVGPDLASALGRRAADQASASPTPGRPAAEGAQEAVGLLVADDALDLHPSVRRPPAETHREIGGAAAGPATPQHDPEADEATAIAAVNQAFPAEEALSVPLDHGRMASGPRVPTPRQRPPELGRS